MAERGGWLRQAMWRGVLPLASMNSGRGVVVDDDDVVVGGGD